MEMRNVIKSAVVYSVALTILFLLALGIFIAKGNNKNQNYDYICMIKGECR